MKYQLCPKCQGQGVVAIKPGTPIGQNYTDSSSGPYTCDVCNGAKVLLVPCVETPDLYPEHNRPYPAFPYQTWCKS